MKKKQKNRQYRNNKLRDKYRLSNWDWNFAKKYCHIWRTFSQTFWHDRTREVYMYVCLLLQCVRLTCC